MTDITSFAMPDNTKRAIFTRRNVFLLSSRALRPAVFRFFLVIPAMIFGLQLMNHGLDAARIAT